MARLDDRADQAADADAVAAHLRHHFGPVRPLHLEPHRARIFGAEKEDVADLHAARLAQRRTGGRLGAGIALLVGRSIIGGVAGDDRLQALHILEVDRRQLGRAFPIGVVEDLALTGGCQHDELVAEVAADRPRVRLHRDRAQPHPREGVEIGDEHAVVAVPRARFVHVERISILHQELAAPHHAEARAHLVTEFPLYVVECTGQIAIRSARSSRNSAVIISSLVGPYSISRSCRSRDAQHLGAVGVVATGLAPKVGGLQRGHEQLDRAPARSCSSRTICPMLARARG